MNKGIKIASGNWIYFLGADDIITNAFSIFLDKVEEEYDIVYGNVQIKETGLLYGKEYQIKDLIRSNPCHQAILYKKVIFEKFGIFNIKYPILSDWDKNIQLWSKIGIKKQYFNICIATFSQAGLSSKYFDDIFWNDAFQKFLVIQSVSKTEAAEAMYPYIIFLAKNGVLFKTIRLALKYSFLSRQKFILFDALSLLMKKMLDES
jgi:glycosyltransferase involved in cell wall biosynthesis